jgi:hypothetical protein
LLADVAGSMGRVLDHFGLTPPPGYLEGIAASRVLSRYSKAPEFEFPPGERQARLAESRHRHRDEIARGLAWLERLARTEARVAELLAAETT